MEQPAITIKVTGAVATPAAPAIVTKTAVVATDATFPATVPTTTFPVVAPTRPFSCDVLALEYSSPALYIVVPYDMTLPALPKRLTALLSERVPTIL